MTSRIYCLIKFFEKEEWADDFLKGNLYCNTLKFFRNLEQGSDGRGDPLEGVAALIQPKGKILKLTPVKGGDSIVLKESDFSGPITVHTDENLSHNIFCMYAIYISDKFQEFSDEELDDDELQKRIDSVNERMKLHEECFEMGEYAVLIYAVEPFMNALKNYESEHGIGINKRLVSYYDHESFDGSFEADKAIFFKQKRFEHQKEYRIAFKSSNDAPFVLRIGSMESYAKKMTSEQIREIEVKVLSTNQISQE